MKRVFFILAFLLTLAFCPVAFCDEGSLPGAALAGVGAPPDDTAYNATDWNGDQRASTKNAIRDKIESLDAAKEDALTDEASLYSTLSDVSDFVQPAEKFTLGITSQTSSGTAVDVSNAATGVNAWYESDSNGTITDFTDGDDHSDFSNGDWFVFAVTDAGTTIDFSTKTNIVGNCGVDYTGVVAQPELFVFEFFSAKWYQLGQGVCKSDANTLAVAAIKVPAYAHFASADAQYSDNATPHVLVTAETKSTVLTNYGATEDRVYTMHAYDFGINFCMQVGAAFQMDLEPPSGGVIVLNGTAAAADEHIINAADTEWDLMCCWGVETANGTYELACKSDNANWAEATP